MKDYAKKYKDLQYVSYKIGYQYQASEFKSMVRNTL